MFSIPVYSILNPAPSSNNADTLPFTSTFPSVGVKIPVNIFNNVDFPAPFGPNNPYTLFSRT